MKTHITLLAAIAAFVLAGCGPKETANTDTPQASTETSAPTAVVAYDLGSKKRGDKGVCVVCNKNEGTTAEEEVKETLDYQGKTYIFCNEAEKADFITDPSKFVKK